MGRCASTKRTRNGFKNRLEGTHLCVRFGTATVSLNLVKYFVSANLVPLIRPLRRPVTVHAQPEALMHKRLILLLGMFLGSHVPTAAQTPAPQIVAAREQVGPVMMMLRTASTPLPAASFLRSQDPGKSPAHFSLLLAGAYVRDYSPEHLSPMDNVTTLILTQSSLPLVPLWGGRLQVEAFQSTLHIQNGQLGPTFSGATRGSHLSGQNYPGGQRSVHLSGLSLSFHFGRDARTGQPAQLWQRLTRSVVAVLN